MEQTTIITKCAFTWFNGNYEKEVLSSSILFTSCFSHPLKGFEVKSAALKQSLSLAKII